MEKLSATTSGEARVDLPGIWKSLPSKPQFVDLAVWLVIFALLGYLAEIFERRTGWLGSSRRKEALTENAAVGTRSAESAPARKPASAFAQVVSRRKQKAASSGTPNAAPQASAPAPPAGQLPTDTAPTDQLEALRLARKRAQDRRGKE